jgi:hypothetical protein
MLRGLAVGAATVVMAAAGAVAYLDFQRDRVRAACEAVARSGVDATFYPHTCFLNGARHPFCWPAVCLRDRSGAPNLERI